MNPSRTSVEIAVKNWAVCFKAVELGGCQPVLLRGGSLHRESGGYAIVFPVDQSGAKKGLKCWIVDVGSIIEELAVVKRYLEKLESGYFIKFQLLPAAVLVNGTILPAMLMEWVDGITLKDFIHRNIGNRKVLMSLLDSFVNMIEYFHAKEIAHGDLQHGNIYVKANGQLVVLDYDSMYVPGLEAKPDEIKGLPGYQHPSRKPNRFANKRLDYFSEFVIYLSILTFAEFETVWNDCYETNDLFFTKEDYENPKASKNINMLLSSGNDKIVGLTNEFLIEIAKSDMGDLRPLNEIIAETGWSGNSAADDIIDLF